MATAKSRRIMGKDKLDKHIHSVFQNHEVPVDTNEIWAGVESSLPRKAPGFPLWYFWAAGLVLIASMGVYIMSQDDQDKNVGTSSTRLSVAAKAISSETNEDVTEAMISQTSEDVAGVGTSDNENTASVTEELNEESLGSREQRTILPAGNEDGSDHTLNESEQPDMTPMTAGSMSAGSVETESTTSETRSLIRPNETNKAISGLSSVSDSEVSQSHGTRSEADHRLTDAVNILNLSESDERANIGVLSLLSREEAVTELLSTDQELNLSLPSLNDCYDFSLRSWLWTLDAYAGFNYAGKSMAWKNRGGSREDYIQNRESTESYLEAFDAGISFSAIHRKGLLAGAGVNYSQINEKFNYFQVRTESRFDSVIIRIEIDSAGRADTIKDWRQVTVQTASEILTYNSYRMVDIPLFIGYQFYKGEWTFEFQGGVMINLLMKKKGEILDPALNVVEITDNELVFKDRIGLSAFGSFKAIYPLTSRLGVYAEPHVRVNLKSITSDDYPVNQRYSQFGLHLGARWIF